MIARNGCQSGNALEMDGGWSSSVAIRSALDIFFLRIRRKKGCARKTRSARREAHIKLGLLPRGAVAMLGLDEAGCGPALGSLVASAVRIPDGLTVDGVMDSKKVKNETARERLFEAILAKADVGIGIVSHAEIDAMGMAEARRLVFERALDDFVASHPDVVIEKLVVDGTIFRPWRDVAYECVPGADATVAQVSAASIVAKVTRDRQIHELCDEHPELESRYGLRSNKGYLTRAHIEGIRTYGKTPYHRMSFRVKL